MRSLTRWFLRARHWQIFVLLVATYVFSAVISIGLEISHPELEHLNRFSPLLLLAEGAWLPLLFCWFGWLWTVGLFLDSLLKPDLKLRTGFFRFAIVYPTLYLLAGLPVFLSDNPTVERVAIPMHLLAMFCILYADNFVAKALKTVNLRRPMIMHEYGKEFLLLFLIPLGIWFIQPRINQLYASAQDRLA